MSLRRLLIDLGHIFAGQLWDAGPCSCQRWSWSPWAIEQDRTLWRSIGDGTAPKDWHHPSCPRRQQKGNADGQ